MHLVTVTWPVLVTTKALGGDVGAAVGVTLGRDLSDALPLQGSRGMHRLGAL